MAKWTKQALKLAEDHSWKAKPGHKIFVADHGAIRFDFPEEWVVDPGSDSVRFYDRQPPDDNCRLEVSLMRLPPIDWSGLPLSTLIQEVVNGDHRNLAGKGDIHSVQRLDLELAWIEVIFMDPAEGREARSRLCLARGSNLQALITLDFWPEDTAQVSTVWDEVLRSLQLGGYIQDPTQGPFLH